MKTFLVIIKKIKIAHLPFTNLSELLCHCINNTSMTVVPALELLW